MKQSELERARAHWAHRGSHRPEWAIAPGPGQESVWDYPRPPRIEQDSRLVRVRYDDTLLAETQRALRLLETASPPTFYIPPDDVRKDLLVPGRGASLCEWKGAARYWSLQAGGNEIPNVAWSYEQPFPEFAELSGHLCFYPGKVECYVDEHRVEAQAGGFYGGWITPEVVGPFKGDPGTGGW